MRTVYNNHKIEVVPSGTGAHCANIYNPDGELVKQVFTLHGPESALQGAKNRLWIKPVKISMAERFRNIFQ